MTISQAKEYFKKAAATGRFSHAYMIESEDTASAYDTVYEFARMLECESGNGCGHCYSCKALSSGNHPDVRTVIGDKKGLISVDNIREQVVGDIIIRPYHGMNKIYIIPDADNMNVQAQNAILKTLEEMPSYGIIILISSNIGRFLPTIISRSFIVRISGECGIGSLSEMDEIFIGLLRGADKLSPADILEGIRNLQGDKKKDSSGERLTGDRAYELSMTWIRDIMAEKSCLDECNLKLPGEKDIYKRLSEKYSYRQLDHIVAEASILRERLQSNVNFELALQLFFMAVRI